MHEHGHALQWRSPCVAYADHQQRTPADDEVRPTEAKGRRTRVRIPSRRVRRRCGRRCWSVGRGGRTRVGGRRARRRRRTGRRRRGVALIALVAESVVVPVVPESVVVAGLVVPAVPSAVAVVLARAVRSVVIARGAVLPVFPARTGIVAAATLVAAGCDCSSRANAEHENAERDYESSVAFAVLESHEFPLIPGKCPYSLSPRAEPNQRVEGPACSCPSSEGSSAPRAAGERLAASGGFRRRRRPERASSV